MAEPTTSDEQGSKDSASVEVLDGLYVVMLGTGADTDYCISEADDRDTAEVIAAAINRALSRAAGLTAQPAISANEATAQRVFRLLRDQTVASGASVDQAAKNIRALVDVYAQPAISAEQVEALTVELFERSHEPSFTDDYAGRAKARQCVVSVLRAAGMTVAGESND